MQLAGNDTEGDEQQKNVDPGRKQDDLEALKERQWLVLMRVRSKDNSIVSMLRAIKRANTADGHSIVGCVPHGFIVFIGGARTKVGGAVIVCHWR